MNDASRDRNESSRSVEHRVEIDASPERVWRALASGEELERWFPLEARVEPGAGGTVWMSWGNEYAGEASILQWEPPRHLRTTWGAPENGEQAQVTDYWIEGRGGSTVLRVVTSGFPADASWDEWVEGTRLGWRYELISLKHYLEHHADRDRWVVYLRRRVQMTRREAWARLMAPDGLTLPAIEGEPVSDEPPRQWAAVVGEPAGALLRLSTEPCMPGVEGVDVTLLLAAWGRQAPERLSALEATWTAELRKLYPEGVDPDLAAGG